MVVDVGFAVELDEVFGQLEFHVEERVHSEQVQFVGEGRLLCHVYVSIPHRLRLSVNHASVVAVVIVVSDVAAWEVDVDTNVAVVLNRGSARLSRRLHSVVFTVDCRLGVEHEVVVAGCDLDVDADWFQFRDVEGHVNINHVSNFDVRFGRDDVIRAPLHACTVSVHVAVRLLNLVLDLDLAAWIVQLDVRTQLEWVAALSLA